MEEFEFDYGGEVAAKEVHVKVWDREGNRTALIDADLLPYQIAFAADAQLGMTAQLLVDEGYYPSLYETPQLEELFDSLCMTLNSWIRLCGCDSAILCTTRSDDNYRIALAYTSEYKGDRAEDKPVFFEELKRAMKERLNTLDSSEYYTEYPDGNMYCNEADDLLSILSWDSVRELGFNPSLVGSIQHKELCSVVVCSSDKDSTITPVYNYNPRKKRMQWVTKIGALEPKLVGKEVARYEYVGTGEYWKRGEKAGQEKTKRVQVGTMPSKAIKDLKGSGLKFFYAQILMGDPADNYQGLPQCGMTGAYELLDGCSTEEELYIAVLGRYKDYYGKGKHWCPNYRGTEDYFTKVLESTGHPPADWEFWKGKGMHLTAYDRMLEQGRLAWMQTFNGEVWRHHKSPALFGNDKEAWYDP